MNSPAGPPSRFGVLDAVDPDTGLVNAVVEAPRGSRCKYKHDEKTGLFRLSKLLPLGAAFPYNFGFVPSTCGEDGDPLDILILTDEPVAVGCMVPVRLVGVFEAKQTETDGRTLRNDRLVGAVETPYNPPEVGSLDELGDERLGEVEHFFVAYNEAEGRKFRPVGRHGPDRAELLVEDGMRRAAEKAKGGRRRGAASPAPKEKRPVKPETAERRHGIPVESGEVSVKRVVRRQYDKALTRLRSKGRGDEAVHDARKSFKKVRAVLRLVRDEIGAKCYRRENRHFREAARPLTEVRDAKALVEALDRLAEHSPEGAGDASLADVRKALQVDRRAVRRRVLRDERAIPAVVSEVEAARDRLPGWSMPHKGWSALAGGIRRTYKCGRRALAAAGDDPTPEALHEWRKQAKYLWHQLQLLEPVWPGVMEELAQEAEALADLLGDDHDLVVLRERLAAAPEEFGGKRRLEALLALIDRRRGELAEEAFVLGRRLYADRPKEFMSRLREYWKAWRANPDAALHA